MNFLLPVLLIIDLMSMPLRMIPPVEYTNGTTVEVSFVNTQAEMNEICGPRVGIDPIMAKMNYVGCAINPAYSGKTKRMWVSNPCNYPEDRYARSLCHEMGHTNGWPGDHPDPR